MPLVDLMIFLKVYLFGFYRYECLLPCVPAYVSLCLAPEKVKECVTI